MTLQYGEYPPALGLGDGAGLLDAYQVSQKAVVALVVGIALGYPTQALLVDGVTLLPPDLNQGCFVHLVADYAAHSDLSELLGH
jgi:hypothetical protein